MELERVCSKCSTPNRKVILRDIGGLICCPHKGCPFNHPARTTSDSSRQPSTAIDHDAENDCQTCREIVTSSQNDDDDTKIANKNIVTSHASTLTSNNASGQMAVTNFHGWKTLVSTDISARDVQRLSFPIWPHKIANCWVNSAMALLLHNDNLKRHISAYPNNKNIMWNLLDRYNRILGYANPMPNNFLNIKPNSTETLIPNRLRSMQSYGFTQLTTRFSDVNYNCPISAIELCLEECPRARNLFQIDYASDVFCEECRNRPVTQPAPPKTDSNQNIASTTDQQNDICKTCQQALKRSLRLNNGFPQSCIYQFDDGVPHNNFKKYDFKHGNKKYVLKAIVEHAKNGNSKHYATYIRDPIRELWLSCNDLQEELAKFSPCMPDIKPSEVHILMWESVNSTVATSDKNNSHIIAKASTSKNEIVAENRQSILKKGQLGQARSKVGLHNIPKNNEKPIPKKNDPDRKVLEKQRPLADESCNIKKNISSEQATLKVGIHNIPKNSEKPILKNNDRDLKVLTLEKQGPLADESCNIKKNISSEQATLKVGIHNIPKNSEKPILKNNDRDLKVLTLEKQGPLADESCNIKKNISSEQATLKVGIHNIPKNSEKPILKNNDRDLKVLTLEKQGPLADESCNIKKNISSEQVTLKVGIHNIPKNSEKPILKNNDRDLKVLTLEKQGPLADESCNTKSGISAEQSTSKVLIRNIPKNPEKSIPNQNDSGLKVLTPERQGPLVDESCNAKKNTFRKEKSVNVPTKQELLKKRSPQSNKLIFSSNDGSNTVTAKVVTTEGIHTSPSRVFTPPSPAVSPFSISPKSISSLRMPSPVNTSLSHSSIKPPPMGSPFANFLSFQRSLSANTTEKLSIFKNQKLDSQNFNPVTKCLKNELNVTTDSKGNDHTPQQSQVLIPDVSTSRKVNRKLVNDCKNNGGKIRNRKRIKSNALKSPKSNRELIKPNPVLSKKSALDQQQQTVMQFQSRGKVPEDTGVSTSDKTSEIEKQSKNVSSHFTSHTVSSKGCIQGTQHDLRIEKEQNYSPSVLASLKQESNGLPKPHAEDVSVAQNKDTPDKILELASSGKLRSASVTPDNSKQNVQKNLEAQKATNSALQNIPSVQEAILHEAVATVNRSPKSQSSEVGYKPISEIGKSTRKRNSFRSSGSRKTYSKGLKVTTSKSQDVLCAFSHSETLSAKKNIDEKLSLDTFSPPKSNLETSVNGISSQQPSACESSGEGKKVHSAFSRNVPASETSILQQENNSVEGMKTENNADICTQSTTCSNRDDLVKAKSQKNVSERPTECTNFPAVPLKRKTYCYQPDSSPAKRFQRSNSTGIQIQSIVAKNVSQDGSDIHLTKESLIKDASHSNCSRKSQLILTSVESSNPNQPVTKNVMNDLAAKSGNKTQPKQQTIMLLQNLAEISCNVMPCESLPEEIHERCDAHSVSKNLVAENDIKDGGIQNLKAKLPSSLEVKVLSENVVESPNTLGMSPGENSAPVDETRQEENTKKLQSHIDSKQTPGQRWSPRKRTLKKIEDFVEIDSVISDSDTKVINGCKAQGRKRGSYKLNKAKKNTSMEISTTNDDTEKSTLKREQNHMRENKFKDLPVAPPTNSSLYNSARNYTKSSKEPQELSSNSNVPVTIQNSLTKTPTEKSKTEYPKVITPVIPDFYTLGTYQEKMELSEDSTCKPNVFDNASIMCQQLVDNAPVEVGENSSLELPEDYSVPSFLHVNQKVTMHKQKQVSNSELCNEKASGIPHIIKGNEELAGILQAVQKFSSMDGPSEKQKACISSTPDDIKNKLPELVVGISKTKKNMDFPINGDRTSVSSSTDLNPSSEDGGKLNKNIKPPSFSQALKQFANSTSGDTESISTKILPSVKIPKALTVLVNSTKDSEGRNQQSGQPSNQTVKGSKIPKLELDITKFSGEKMALFATPSPLINLPSQVKGRRIGKNGKVYVLGYSSTDKNKPSKILDLEKMNVIPFSTNTTCLMSNNPVQDCTMTKINESNSCNTSEDKIELSPKESLAPEAHSNQNSQVASKCAMKRKNTDRYLTPCMRTYPNVPKRSRKLSNVENCTGLKQDNLLCSNAIETESTISIISQNLQYQEKRDLAMEVETSQSAMMRPEVELPVPSASTIKQPAQCDASTQMFACLCDSCIQTPVEHMCDSNPSSQESLHANLPRVPNEEELRQMLLLPDLIADRQCLKLQVDFGLLTIEHIGRKPEKQSTDHSLAKTHLVGGPLETRVECTRADHERNLLGTQDLRTNVPPANHEKTTEHRTEIAKRVGKASPKRTITVSKDSPQAVSHLQGKMSHPHGQVFKSNEPPVSSAQKPTSNAQLKQAPLDVSEKCMWHSSTLPPFYFKESEKFIPLSSLKKLIVVSTPSSHQKTNFLSATKNQSVESPSISLNHLLASKANPISSKQSVPTPVHAVKASLNTSPKLPGLINSCQFINFTPSRANAYLTSDKQNHVPGKKTANQTQLDNSHIIQNIPVKNPQIEIDLKTHTLESAVPCTDEDVSTPLNINQATGIKRPYRVKKSQSVDSNQFSPEENCRRTKRSTAGLRPKRYSVSRFESEDKKEEEFSQMNVKLCKDVKAIKEVKQCSPAKESREDKILPNKTVSGNSPLACTNTCKPSPPTHPKSPEVKYNEEYKTSIFSMQKRYHISPPSTSHIKEKLRASLLKSCEDQEM